MKRYLIAGKFVSVHGLHGELKIYPYCDSAEMLAGFKHLYLDEKGSKELKFDRLRVTNNMVLIKILGIDSVEEARRYIDRLIYFDRQDYKLEEGVHFIDDLLGCSVEDAMSTKVYGKLIDVTSNGAHDVYHVKMINGETRFIPVVPAFIDNIDITTKVIKVNPIPGMLEE